MTARRRVATQVASDRVDVEVESWRIYVASFIRAHDLDAGQRTAATSVLSEMCQRAGTHRAARRDEINTLERRIASFSGSKDELAELKKQLLRLYGPFDAMFSELENRLLLILTVQQRARMAAPKPASDDGNESGKRPRNP